MDERLPITATPTEVLREIFTPGVLAPLRRQPSAEVAQRLSILTATGSLPPAHKLAEQLARFRIQRAAWEAYATAARATGILDDDAVARLRSPLPEQFRSAMAECEASWVLTAGLGFKVGARQKAEHGVRRPEFLVTKDGEAITVEVKAPWSRLNLTEPIWGDESGVLGKTIDAANRQFSPDTINLLVLVPTLTLPLLREALVNAFLGRDVITGLVGPSDVPFGVTFVPSGPLLKRGPEGPRYTRTGAILVIDEHFAEYRKVSGEYASRIAHRLFVLHNPNAPHGISPGLFGGHPQLILRDGEMRWTAPWDGTDYVREIDKTERVGQALALVAYPDPEERERAMRGLDLVAAAAFGDSPERRP